MNDVTLTMRRGAAADNQRNAGLDLVRCIAILFVIAGHFFLHTQFKTTVFSGVSMFIQGMGLTLFKINVALFMILTGYLNINKRIERKYYCNGLRVILSYIFISVVIILFRRYFNGEDYTWLQWILKITDFSAIPYAWYIEMWIGLFLLTPFLNILWHNIETKRHKHILLFTLYLLTALPDFFNRYGVSLAPGWWENVFPLEFYFLGAYVREYRPDIPKWKLCLAILAICLVNPVFNVLFIRNHSMIQIVGDGNGLFGIPLAVMVFLLLSRCEIKNNMLRKVIALVSVLSLDMYLFSWMFDDLVYGYVNSLGMNQQQLGLLFFAIVGTVFVLSFCAAWLKRVCFKILHLPT